MRTQVGDKGSARAGREGGRQVRSSKRNGWLSSLIRLEVLGCVVSLTSLVCSTDHVVESDCNSGSRSKLELSANVHRLVSLGLGLSVSHGLPPPRDASKAGGQGPKGGERKGKRGTLPKRHLHVSRPAGGTVLTGVDGRACRVLSIVAAATSMSG